MQREKKNSIYDEVCRMSFLGIAIALFLSFLTSFFLSTNQESRSRDQALSIAAQVAANAPVLMDDVDHAASAAYIRRTVRNVSSVDVFAVYDAAGKPIAFYDLATDESDPGGLPQLDESVIAWFAKNAGETLLSDAQAPEGTDRCAYAEILTEGNEVAGYAMAGIYMRSIRYTVLRTLLLHLLAAIAALLIGGELSLSLSSSIKDKLMGYEPDDFRQLFIQRGDILDALEEGLLVIDTDSRITYINRVASDILRVEPAAALGHPLREIYPRSTIARVIKTGRPEYNISLESITHVSVISDRLPIWRGKKVEGAIAIFRDRTELTGLAQELTGVQHIVEALRAYTHEFTNKLHVILGLLQLGETKKAEEYVLQITQTRVHSAETITRCIHDPSIAALLIGKSYRAAELGIGFTLAPGSELKGNGQFIPASGLITVLGNLIENAFDAMRGAPTGTQNEVTVSIREGEHALLISVDDTGPGIAPKVYQHIFERGFSTHGEGRGTGLALVKDVVDTYHGELRVETEQGVGTSFIITVKDS